MLLTSIERNSISPRLCSKTINITEKTGLLRRRSTISGLCVTSFYTRQQYGRCRLSASRQALEQSSQLFCLPKCLTKNQRHTGMPIKSRIGVSRYKPQLIGSNRTRPRNPGIASARTGTWIMRRRSVFSVSSPVLSAFRPLHAIAARLQYL